MCTPRNVSLIVEISDNMDRLFEANFLHPDRFTDFISNFKNKMTVGRPIEEVNRMIRDELNFQRCYLLIFNGTNYLVVNFSDSRIVGQNARQPVMPEIVSQVLTNMYKYAVIPSRVAVN